MSTTPALPPAMPATRRPPPFPLDLICCSGNPRILRIAAETGAHVLRLLCRTGRSSSEHAGTQAARLAEVVRHARSNSCTAQLEIAGGVTSTVQFRQAGELFQTAVNYGIRELVVSDPALALYARTHFPYAEVRLALSTPLSTPLGQRGMALVRRQLGVRRVVLPRVLNEHELAQLARDGEVEFDLHANGAHTAFLWMPTLDLTMLPDPERACGSADNAANDTSFGHGYDQLHEIAMLLPRLSTLGVRGLLIEPTGRSRSEVNRLIRRWRGMLDSAFPRRA